MRLDKKAEDFVEIFRKMASPPGLEPGAPCLGVDPIQHREVTPDAKKCLEIQAFSAFAFPSDTTL